MKITELTTKQINTMLTSEGAICIITKDMRYVVFRSRNKNGVTIAKNKLNCIADVVDKDIIAPAHNEDINVMIDFDDIVEMY